MSSESDLLRVILAIKNELVTPDQISECGAVWAEDRSKSLTAILEEKGTGLDFFPDLPDDVEDALEKEKATELWPVN